MKVFSANLAPLKDNEAADGINLGGFNLGGIFSGIATSTPTISSLDDIINQM